MNIIKSKNFLVNIPDIEGMCNAYFINKNQKDYILISKENKKLFKICLNEENEFEYYEKTIPLNAKKKEEIINIIKTISPKYIIEKFNYEDFFIVIKPLKIERLTIPYSLYLEEREDYLIKHEWIAKTIQIESKYFECEVTVFIYREKNILLYGVINNFKKVAKYVFEIKNDMLNLISEERYNGYKDLNFLEFKEEFKNLTTTSHEMQRDISSKDINDMFVMKTYKKLFSIIE